MKKEYFIYISGTLFALAFLFIYGALLLFANFYLTVVGVGIFLSFFFIPLYAKPSWLSLAVSALPLIFSVALAFYIVTYYGIGITTPSDIVFVIKLVAREYYEIVCRIVLHK